MSACSCQDLFLCLCVGECGCLCTYLPQDDFAMSIKNRVELKRNVVSANGSIVLLICPCVLSRGTFHEWNQQQPFSRLTVACFHMTGRGAAGRWWWRWRRGRRKRKEGGMLSLYFAWWYFTNKSVRVLHPWGSVSWGFFFSFCKET